MRLIKILLGTYSAIVLFHSTDLNPVWYWGWYAENIGAWFHQSPRFFLLNFFFAFSIIMWIVSEKESGQH